MLDFFLESGKYFSREENAAIPPHPQGAALRAVAALQRWGFLAA